jgi:DNA-directed RNA polymerase subunit omega
LPDRCCFAEVAGGAANISGIETRLSTTKKLVHFAALSYNFSYGVKRMTNESAFHNKYSLVKGAARRARQLQSGASPLIVAKSMKACRVAQDEIKQGHVKFVLPEKVVEPVLDLPVH